MRNLKPLPPVELLRELIAYDPDTGLMVWKEREPRHFASGSAKRCTLWNRRYAGNPALACVSKDGYGRGYIASSMCLAHRVAYAIYHGVDPDFEIDHINGVSTDNRIENLRRSDPTTNNRNLAAPKNNTSGAVGVNYIPARWKASISVDNKPVHLGYFETFEEALQARKAGERKYGYHENHGRRGDQ